MFIFMSDTYYCICLMGDWVFLLKLISQYRPYNPSVHQLAPDVRMQTCETVAHRPFVECFEMLPPLKTTTSVTLNYFPCRPYHHPCIRVCQSLPLHFSDLPGDIFFIW